jgi:WD40 repeat protein
MAYDGFISYSHAADGRLAPALQRGLQLLAKPWNSRRALRIFRDETGLSTNPHLWSAIEKALDESQWFVLFASPEAARSEWVNKEISHWLATKAVEHILPVVTDGTWEWDRTLGDFTPESSAVPEALRGALADEPRHLDLRWARTETDLDLRNTRFRSSVADLAAPIHGVAKDELEGEDVRQHRRTRRLARAGVSALVILVVIAVALGVLALASRNQAVSTSTTARAQALAAESLSELSADPEVSVLLARQAVEVSPIPKAVAALRQALDASPVRLALPTAPAKLCGFGNNTSGPTIAYNPAGTRVAESLCTGDVVVFDARSGHVVYRRHLSTQASTVAYSPNGRVLAVGTRNGVDLLDPSTGAVQATLDGHGEPQSVAFNPTGSQLAAISPRGTTVWDLPSGMVQVSLTYIFDGDVAFTPDGTFLVVGTGGPTKVVDVASGRIMHTLSPPGQTLASGQTNPIALEGTTLVMGANVTGPGDVDGDIDLWDTRTWTMSSVLTAVTGTGISDVAISSDGQKVAVGNADGTGGVWSVTPDEEQVTLSGQTADINSIAFSPNGADVATAANDGTARIYRAGGPWLNTMPATLCGCGNEFGWQQHKLVALDRSGNDVLLESWLLPSGRPLPDPPVLATDQQSLGVALSSDGALVAIWNDGAPTSTVRVLDTATRRLVFTLPATSISGVAFSDDDRLLVVADQSGGLHITTLSSGHTMVGHGWTQNCSTSAGYPPAVSSDDRLVAVYSFCGQVSVGRVRTAKPFETFDQRGQLAHIAFDPAGDRLALGSWDDTVTVLNVATDRPALELVGDTRGVNGVAYSPDGRYIATTSTDDTMRVWNATTGQLMQVDQDETGPASPSFNPDGQILAETNNDNQIRLWPVCPDCSDPAALLSASRPSVVSPLTPLERAEVASQAG